MRSPTLFRGRPASGFTLVELIVSMGLLSLSVIGLLTVFDSANRMNKSQLQSAELQQSLRVAMFEMQRTVRMAGVGDLPITQAIVVTDPTSSTSYNNVAPGYVFADADGADHPVRPGTDVLEIRGVIETPLLALSSAGCGRCEGAAEAIVIPEVTRYGIRNDDAAQFRYLLAAFNEPGQHLFVVSSQDVNVAEGGGFANVALATAVTLDAGNARAIVTGDFTHADALRFNGTAPYGATAAIPLEANVRGGLLDDVVFFLDDSDPKHPALAMGVLRQVNPRRFDVLPIAADIEDLQFAYGIDGINGTVLDGSIGDTFSTVPGADEWLPNAPSESAASLATFVGPSGPRLRSIMIVAVSKAAEPDLAYRGRPGAAGVQPLDSAAAPVSTSPINRKTMRLRVNLRNYNRGA